MVMDPSVLACRFPAQPDQVALARRRVVAYAREHGAIDPDGIAVAVSEAVTNAVVHAYADSPLRAMSRCSPGAIPTTVSRSRSATKAAA